MCCLRGPAATIAGARCSTTGPARSTRWAQSFAVRQPSNGPMGKAIGSRPSVSRQGNSGAGPETEVRFGARCELRWASEPRHPPLLALDIRFLDDLAPFLGLRLRQ